MCFLLLCFLAGNAQEQLVPQGKNTLLLNREHKIKSKGNSDTLWLPFIDDFSRDFIDPMENLWLDRDVFINRSFAVNPPGIGVATFDANDENGGVYSYATQNAAMMDKLTSKPLRLDSFIDNQNIFPLQLSDSVYLSFYVQPAGNGDAPETQDSIVLQFYNPTTAVWNSIWKHEGLKLDSFRNLYGTDFLKVMIPIIDTAYFKPDFQFRFLNYASIPNAVVPSWKSGMYDFWNLDYVYLNKKRSYLDTCYDIIILSNVNSLLKNYISMPWKQFKLNANAEMDYTKSILTTNLSQENTLKNVSRYFSIYSKTDDSLYKAIPFPNTVNMGALSTQTFSPVYSNYVYNSQSNSNIDFMVMYVVKNQTPPLDLLSSNDTLLFFQKFYNYYAYDDGIPEAGYGLSVADGKTAVKFTLNAPDTLRSIQMFFNQTIGAANQQYFDLVVWADNAGKPGAEIYRKSGKRPEFETDLFKFHTYLLTNPIPVSGTFYVGMEQLTNNNLNIGFDLNNNHQSENFFNIAGTWFTSTYQGSLMIRPILGSSDTAFVGIENPEIYPPQLQIFPNPAQAGLINLVLNMDGEDFQIEIFNLQGQKVMEIPFSNQIYCKLNPGVYMLKCSGKSNSKVLTSKLVITQ